DSRGSPCVWALFSGTPPAPRLRRARPLSPAGCSGRFCSRSARPAQRLRLRQIGPAAGRCLPRLLPAPVALAGERARTGPEPPGWRSRPPAPPAPHAEPLRKLLGVPLGGRYWHSLEGLAGCAFRAVGFRRRRGRRLANHYLAEPRPRRARRLAGGLGPV